MDNLAQHTELNTFIETNEKKSKSNLIAAVVLSLIGFVALFYFILFTKYGDYIFNQLNIYKIISLLIGALLLQVPACMLAWAFGISSDQAQKLRKELIKLRDLENAIDLSKSLGQTDITDSEKDIRSRIVKTMLDKYAN